MFALPSASHLPSSCWLALCSALQDASSRDQGRRPGASLAYSVRTAMIPREERPLFLSSPVAFRSVWAMNPESGIMAGEQSMLSCPAWSPASPSHDLKTPKPCLIGSPWEVIYYQTKGGGGD